jgi:glutathione S-transferase
VAVAHRRVVEPFEEIEAHLGPGGYLVGDHFTVADLTAAALLAPIVHPHEYPDAAWKQARFPDELLELRDRMTSRPGGEWVLEMYRRHRERSAEA